SARLAGASLQRNAIEIAVCTGNRVDVKRRAEGQVLARTTVQRFSNTQAGSESFGKFSTLFLFSTGYKSVDLICSAWK
ncbi:MAG: hypothetical protein WAL05_13525, partial [Candidatus Sulfotelmatobacter sp.]